MSLCFTSCHQNISIIPACLHDETHVGKLPLRMLPSGYPVKKQSLTQYVSLPIMTEDSTVEVKSQAVIVLFKEVGTYLTYGDRK